jgi:hypothetical protein
VFQEMIDYQNLCTLLMNIQTKAKKPNYQTMMIGLLLFLATHNSFLEVLPQMSLEKTPTTAWENFFRNGIPARAKFGKCYL